MATDEQKPDPSLLKLQYPSLLSDASLECNRTLSFKAWMVERAASREGVPRQSSKTQTPPPGLLMIKDGPPGFSPEDYLNPAARDLTGPRNKLQTLPPSKETIVPKRPLPLQGPPGISRDEHLNPPCNKVQTHPPSNETIIPKRPCSLQGPPGISRDEHLNPPCNKAQAHPPPNELPFSRGNPSPTPRPNPFQELKLLPKTIVPTGPRSFLKRKATTPEKPATPPLPPSKMRKSADNLVCDLCVASCSSALVMQQHLRGRKHKAKISFNKRKRESNTTTASKPRCDLCEIWCCDVGALQMHFKGQKHMAKVQELQLCKERGGQKSSKAPIICEVCGVSCMNQDSFEQHLKGRQHAVKQDLKRRGLL
ncbi:hypothetical protein SASPL_151492 [Salvia splendens]|uniref:C2H2-type domain-containing protein n=1 Tax=Salvia splendens TaxID=180675 RepID=A0A8X8Z3N3_SALSN|nr:hypothetical protein SASPL_151492 [Salvia splendens]